MTELLFKGIESPKVEGRSADRVRIEYRGKVLMLSERHAKELASKLNDHFRDDNGTTWLE